jgi:geranylgeranyl diphosphate synthase type II
MTAREAPSARASFPLARYLEERAAEIEASLERLLPGPDTPPSRIHQAMRHAVFAGGKRLRPILVLAGCEAAGGDRRLALPFACAIETIHTYSLVHDDLPALDNDDLRRGRPTVHQAFDEATAILAGDALLTFAVETALASTGGEPLEGASRRLRALEVLLGAIGTRGMIGGQVDDLLMTGKPADEATVRSIHERKTGALLGACPVVGGILAGGPAELIAHLESYGADLGLAFQITDDILDVTGSPSTLGKSPGKDAASGKATYPAAIGLPASRERAAELAARAGETVRGIGAAADPLVALAEFVIGRSR